MRHHVDVSAVLKRTVCDVYSNLVTRPTGVAVRQAIETYMDAQGAPCLMIIDFSEVGLLDFSCADEVVGKLMDDLSRSMHGTEAYIIVRGARNDHLEAIEAAIDRYHLAVIVEHSDGSTTLVGRLDDALRRAWFAVRDHGRVSSADLALEFHEPADVLVRVLDTLWERRLVMRDHEQYVSLNQAP